MSLNTTIDNQLRRSTSRLSSISSLASYLLEDVRLTIDRRGINPIIDTDFYLKAGVATVNQAAAISIADTNGFVDATSNRIRAQIREVTGHSPDIVSDIIKKIGDTLKKVIEKALKPVTDIIKELGKNVKKGMSSIVDGLEKTFKSVLKNTAEFVTKGFKALGNGVTFIQSTVNKLLKTVADKVEVFTLMLRKALSDLGKDFEALLRITPQQLFNLQKELQRLFQLDQSAFIEDIVMKAKKPTTED